MNASRAEINWECSQSPCFQGQHCRWDSAMGDEVGRWYKEMVAGYGAGGGGKSRQGWENAHSFGG